MNDKSSNIVWHQTKITKVDRQRLNGHKSCVLWFTGLSGSGKSTLANEIEKVLYRNGIRTYILDGDNIRHGLNKDLDFSPKDRTENIRRIGEVSKLFVDAGLFVISAFISPYKEDRNMVRLLFERKEFIEIHVKCSLKECEKRDPKGLYKKAKSGEIKQFTGISAPYEEPTSPEIVVETEKYSIKESINKIVEYLLSNGYLDNDYDIIYKNG